VIHRPTKASKVVDHSTPDLTYRTYYKWLPKESRSNIDEFGSLHPDAPYPQHEV